MSKRANSAIQRDKSNYRQVCFRQVDQELTKIAMVFDKRTFYKRFIGAVNIATTFSDDIDGWAKERKVQSIIINGRHLKIGP